MEILPSAGARVSVTEEAIEAAHAQAARDMSDQQRPDRHEVRRILEAAAPYLIAFPMGMTQDEWKQYVRSYQ
jgi:hypothetical protein